MKLVSFPEKRIALAFSDYLSSIGLPNHLEQNQDGFSLLIDNSDDIAQARLELDAFISSPQDNRYWQASWQSGHAQAEPVYPDAGTSTAMNWWHRGGKLTRAVALLCVVVFAGLNLMPTIFFEWLHYPSALTASAIGAQWWRLLTPAILHFSLMHIAFNLLWWWELGGLIERGQSALRLLGISVVIAMISNAAQGIQYGPNFGGLSGVIYGLLGYLWLYPIFNPAAGFRMRKEILWFMLGWLAIGYTGVLDVLFGPVSNVGHLSGLLAGMGLGVVIGLANRGQKTKDLSEQI
ncbi:MAG: rhomboid family intramembrane serine protease GlpG [Moraxellaceae bacterium]|nr:rhomboid family intramembrane serine protease GlpG [Moraxellaceae bacterium]MBP7229175.1 rhomboid family intramembrane serine protease GlpG [Moraxellaceae bacterium]MBP8851627.1 rhomboid family intramembrane serine protease GlpG [Moraxellaceae bacterium]MBP9045111.1 rhomboid family intramembrane serine protease GlpG [Moraxellaceae bacterium]MBP9729899.1 rhomboid family intramembrane serine protease GlpG [Moraxellaceae bacterium]